MVAQSNPSHFGSRIEAHTASHTVREMPCPERMRLMGLYSKATRHMSEMVTALSDVAISYELDVFNRAWEQCENAQRHCSDIRNEIYHHVTDHRCALLVREK